MKTHVNRLVKFHPWSDHAISTSTWEDKHTYRMGEWASNNALIIIPLLQPYPFGVARLTKAHRDGAIDYQWWGNASNTTTGTYRPGWIKGDSKSGKQLIYYADAKREATHAPYYGQTEMPMTQKDIVVHSFELTRSHKMPIVVLKAIDQDYRVWWTMKPLHKDASTTRVPNSTHHEKSELEDDSDAEVTGAQNSTHHEKSELDGDSDAEVTGAPNSTHHEKSELDGDSNAEVTGAPNSTHHEKIELEGDSNEDTSGLPNSTHHESNGLEGDNDEEMPGVPNGTHHEKTDAKINGATINENESDRECEPEMWRFRGTKRRLPDSESAANNVPEKRRGRSARREHRNNQA